MVLMEKGKERLYVADVHIPSFRNKGYTVVGEEPKASVGNESVTEAKPKKRTADKRKTPKG